MSSSDSGCDWSGRQPWPGVWIESTLLFNCGIHVVRCYRNAAIVSTHSYPNIKRRKEIAAVGVFMTAVTQVADPAQQVFRHGRSYLENHAMIVFIRLCLHNSAGIHGLDLQGRLLDQYTCACRYPVKQGHHL